MGMEGENKRVRMRCAQVYVFVSRVGWNTKVDPSNTSSVQSSVDRLSGRDSVAAVNSISKALVGQTTISDFFEPCQM